MSHSDSDLTQASSELTIPVISPAFPPSPQNTLSHSLPNTGHSRCHGDSKNSAALTTSRILSLVGEVSKAVSDVPYLGAIGTVVTTLIKIRDELEAQKERSQELLDKVLKKIEGVFEHLLDLKDCSHRGDLGQLNAQMQKYHDFLVQVVKIISKLQKRKFHQRIFDRGTNELERLDRMINDFNTDLILSMLVNIIKTSAKQEQPQTNASSVPEIRGNIGAEDDIAAGMLVPPLPLCILEREAQHDEVVAKLLLDSNARVAILGMGGIGKTTLACSIASDSQIVDAYPRRLFLSFEGCSTPDLAYTNLAAAFQTPADRRSSHRQILSHVLAYLKQEKTLFVIDNFETFWELASNRRTAEELLGHLASLQNLAMIVTLRGIQRPGNIRWIKIEPLQALTQDASKELLFAISNEEYLENNSEYIQKLLDAVAGIPLAVTLIGTLLRDESETPQSLWHQWLQESARAIRVASDPTSDDRLYKLDTSLRLSIFGPRMNDDTRCMLAAISILPIGLNMDEEWLDSFQKLFTDTFRARDCIRTLRDVALVTLDSSTSPPRLRMLPPVRDFCLKNLPLDGEQPQKLIDIYNTDLSRYWDWASKGHYTWATTELSNLTAILNHAINIGYVTNDLGRATLRYTNWRRYLRIPDAETAKRAIDIMSDYPAAQALCLQAYGATLSGYSQEQEAVQPLKDALAIHRKLENTQKVAEVLYFLGHNYYVLKDYANAEHHLSEARDLTTEIDDNWIKGSVLQALSGIYLDQNKLQQAENVAEEALVLCSASHNRTGAINALRALGIVHRERGHYDFAIKTLTLARDASQAIHDTHAQACIAESLGYVYRGDDKPDQAAMHFRLAVSLFEQAQCPMDAENSRAALRKLETSLDTPNDQ